jgi:hypothetical protein
MERGKGLGFDVTYLGLDPGFLIMNVRAGPHEDSKMIYPTELCVGNTGMTAMETGDASQVIQRVKRSSQ